MAMRMPPDVANQPAFPDVNRASLVFFGGVALMVLNFYWVNGSALTRAIFSKGQGGQPLYGYTDVGLQVLGLFLLVLMAEYGGEGASTFALLFLVALWLGWLINHLHTSPGAAAQAKAQATKKQ